MIEINLLPGGGKKARGRSVGAGLAGSLSAVLAKVKDPYLLSAVGSGIAAVAIIVLLFLTQAAREHILIAKEQKAVQDSTRYATIVAEKRKAEAERDLVLRQVNIIKAIDDDRFIWTHIMDEISRVVPPYTWLTAVAQTSEVVSPAAAPKPATPDKAGTPKKEPAKEKDAQAKVDTAVVRTPLTFRIVGLTVDIQALTRFMRFLETSPFIQNVQLAKSTPLIVEGNQVTEFQLDAEYETPDPAAIRRVPFTLSGR